MVAAAALSKRFMVLEVKPRERPTDDAIAWLLVERTEAFPPDSGAASLRDPSIRLAYRRLDRKNTFAGGGVGGGEFSASCRTSLDEAVYAVSITDGAVFLDLPGLEGNRIGTYLMNEIVKWTKNNCPNSYVLPIELREEQAYGENRERRNRFYERFGIVFEFTDRERKVGRSKRMQVKDLKTVDTWQQNITVYSVEDVLSNMLQEQRGLHSKIRSLESLCERLYAWRQDAEERPLRWLVRRLFGRT